MVKAYIGIYTCIRISEYSSILALALERLRRGVRHNEKHHTTSLICFWLHLRLYLYVYLQFLQFLCNPACSCLFIPIYASLHVHLYMLMRMHMYLSAHTCIYVCMYVHILLHRQRPARQTSGIFINIKRHEHGSGNHATAIGARWEHDDEHQSYYVAEVAAALVALLAAVASRSGSRNCSGRGSGSGGSSSRGRRSNLAVVVVVVVVVVVSK